MVRISFAHLAAKYNPSSSANMIRISKLADYAVVILAEMAREPAVLSATAIASATQLSETTVAKVLKTLAHGNLLAATRGAAGGYALTRAAVHITMRDIIEAMDGPIGIVDCTEHSRADCQLTESCQMKTNWTPVNNTLRAALTQITLADMMQNKMREVA